LKNLIYILLLAPLFAKAQTSFQIPGPGFKSCLVNKYSNLLDANNDLIIAKADTSTKEISCVGLDIVDITGIGYFNSVTSIDFSNNKITTLNGSGIEALSKLKTLKLGTNQLSEIPSLSKLIALEEIVLQSNFISKLPELSNNTNLKSVILHTNRLTEIPDLSKLTNLTFLNIARNETLTKTPSLIGLNKLQYYYAWLCSMKTLPDLSHLTELVELNIGYNQLTSLPDFSNNQKLVLIYANHNKITSIPDFSTNPALTKVRLYNNYLTIDKVESTQSVINFESIFPFAPQESLPISISPNQDELSDFFLQATDNYKSTTMSISWFKNGSLLWTGSEDTFHIKSLSPLDEGKYSYSITSTLFPGLTLTSDTLSLIVKPCYYSDEFNINTLDSKCTNLGSIQISKSSNVNQGILYTIKNGNQNHTTKDSIHLKADEYQLFAEVTNGCTIDLGKTTIEQIKCDDYFFSPNNDGQDDEFFFEQDGRIEIYNRWGLKIKTIEGPAYWDGKDSKGQLVPSGYYKFISKNSKKESHLTVIH
jgi:internalin A